MTAPLAFSPEELTAEIRRISHLVSQFDEVMVSGLEAPEDAPPSPAEPEPQPVFPCVEAWVNEYFIQVFSRVTGGQWRWCAKWWRHPEAQIRLEALWRSWETLRLEPNGIATWLRDHLDPQMAALLSPSGTFAVCTSDRHTEAKPLSTSRSNGEPHH
jgi:hypothetical protein